MELLNNVAHDQLILEPPSAGSVPFAFTSPLMVAMSHIDSVHRLFISFEFSADGAFVAPQNPCNLTGPSSLRLKNGYDVPLLTG